MCVNAIRKTMIRALEGLDVKVKANRDRAYIELFEADPYEVIEALSHVTGILSVSPVVKMDRTEEAMKETALNFAADFKEGSSFKIEVKRADKAFHLKTFDIQDMLGGLLLKNTEHIRVDVRKPDYKIMVEVRLDAIYMYHDVISCVGGLPAGT